MNKLTTLVLISLLFLFSCKDSTLDEKTQYNKIYENRFETDSFTTDGMFYEIFTDTTIIDLEQELEDRDYRIEKLEQIRLYQLELALDEESLFPIKNLDFVDSIEVYMRAGEEDELLIAKAGSLGDNNAGKREIGILIIPDFEDEYRQYLEAGDLHYRILFQGNGKIEFPTTLKLSTNFNIDVKRFGI